MTLTDRPEIDKPAREFGFEKHLPVPDLMPPKTEHKFLWNLIY